MRISEEVSDFETTVKNLLKMKPKPHGSLENEGSQKAAPERSEQPESRSDHRKDESDPLG